MSAITPPNRLFVSTFGLHAADQLAMAALPLVAVLAYGGGPGLVGTLLAVQAAAWLLLSLPAGLLVDRFARRSLLALAATAALAGALLAPPAADRQWTALLGVAVFVGSCGTVLYVLAATALVPTLVASDGLTRANARLEFARALASLGAPPVAGLLASWGSPVAAYGVAAAAAAAALLAARALPPSPVPPSAPGATIVERLTAGGRFVVAHPLLRGIGACALFWNFGFFALMTAFVPYALGGLGLGAASLGLVQAGLGAGLIAGAVVSAEVQRRFGPNVILVAGPLLSAATPLLLLATSRGTVGLPFLAMVLVGFGPVMWSVCQTSVRQTVTPTAMLGRVGASLQVANYGVRPLGALASGALSGTYGAEAGLWLAAAAFLVSVAVAVGSDLVRLRRLPEGSPA